MRDYRVEPKRVYFFRAITSVHAGAGIGTEHIDLPIQREQHTGYPVIYASGIKGAWRQEALERLAKDCGKRIGELDEMLEKGEFGDCPQLNTLAQLFGMQDRRGSLTITDAKILFFPVKSLRGVFAYVTCPFVLKRFANETKLGELEDIKLQDDEVIASNALLIEGNTVVLEEFELKKVKTPNGVLDKLGLPEELKNLVSQRLAVVSDDVFTYFVQNFTEVVERIKIDPETGTVKAGALWTEENLPAESVLYSLYFESFKVEGAENYLPKDGSITVLGGDQTVGRGILKLYTREVEK